MENAIAKIMMKKKQNVKDEKEGDGVKANDDDEMAK